MRMICPRCEAAIANADDHNGSFTCPECELEWFATELLYESESVDKAAKLNGTWLDRSDGRTTVGASARSWLAPLPIAISLPLPAFSVFLLVGSYEENPDLLWITGPIAALLSLVALYLLWKGAMFIGGRVEVHIEGDEGAIFTGIGKFGRTRRFKVSQTWYVRRKRDIVRSRRHGRLYTVNALILNGSFNAITFAGILNEERRSFLHAALVRLLPRREL